MCFSGEMSGAFAAIGLFLSIWVYTKVRHDTTRAAARAAVLF